MNFNYNDDDGYKYSENQTDADKNKNKVRQLLQALPKPVRMVVVLLVFFLLILVVSKVAQIIDNELPFFQDTTPTHTHEYNSNGVCSCGAHISGEGELDYGQLEEDGTECAILCDWCNICPDQSHLHAKKCTCTSQGLKFESNNDGTCTVTGIGSCLDSNLIIPKMSPSGDIVTTIGERAFQELPIKTVKLPTTITLIDWWAFKGCTNLTEFVMPPELKKIERSAFEECSSLRTLTFNTKVEEIQSSAFANCTSLTTINFATNATYVYISNAVFQNCTSLTSLEFTMPVKLSPYVFEGCNSLTEVTFKEKVELYSSFYQLTTLRKVVCEKDVILKTSFRDLSGLEELHFLGQVTPDGSTIAMDCPKLNIVHFSNHGVFVDGIRRELFRNCPNIKNIYFHGTQDQWEMFNFFKYDVDLKGASVHIVP